MPENIFFLAALLYGRIFDGINNEIKFVVMISFKIESLQVKDLNRIIDNNW